MRKVVRVLCYLKELCLMAFFKLFGAACRCCSAKYRELWLVCERGNDARDNGYWFYRYLKEKHPEINARYVIETDSADRAKIEALGGMVPRGSFSHYLAYYCADFLIGTHVQPCAPDLILFYHLAGKGIRSRGKQVFCSMALSRMKWNGCTVKICIWICLSAERSRNMNTSAIRSDIRNTCRSMSGWRGLII